MFPDHFLEQPHALDVSAGGTVAVLDRGGRRLCLGRAGRPPREVRLDFAAQHCRFRGDELVLLGEDHLRTFDADGRALAGLPLRAGALNLAVTPAGSVLVSYGRRGVHEHGVTLERLGPAPLLYHDPAVLDATSLAVESGAIWIAGTGAAPPAARAVRLRPAPGGLTRLAEVALPAPPRAAAIGPDGALFVVLEPGESLVRVHGGEPESPVRLAEPVHDLARGERTLLACGPRGLADLGLHVPAPPLPAPPPDIPSCPA